MATVLLIGFNAICAPNILYLLPELFGRSISQSITGLVMAFMYVGALALPAMFGLGTQAFSIGFLPLYLTAVFLLLISSAFTLKKRTKSQPQENSPPALTLHFEKACHKVSLFNIYELPHHCPSWQ